MPMFQAVAAMTVAMVAVQTRPDALFRLPRETVRVGDVARKLSDKERTALLRAIPGEAKPWLLYGETSPVVAGDRPYIEAYLPPRTSTSTLIRGSTFALRQTAPATWVVVSGPHDDAQVAINGLSFDKVQWRQIFNRPFRVVGAFDDTELLSIAAFLREVQTSKELRIRLLGVRRDLPIRAMRRQSDELVVITLSLNDWSGQDVELRRQGDTWTVVGAAHWVA